MGLAEEVMNNLADVITPNKFLVDNIPARELSTFVRRYICKEVYLTKVDSETSSGLASRLRVPKYRARLQRPP